MRKSYIFVYSDVVGTREQVKDILDDLPIIKTWRYDMPNCFYLISESSADEISRQFRSKNGNKGRHIILESTRNKQGWLPEDTWFLLNNKYLTPKSD